MVVLNYIPEYVLPFVLDAILLAFIKVLNILELISYRVIYLSKLIADYKINNDYVTKKIKQLTKENLLRHLESRYTELENKVIKNTCSKDIFPYYYFFCDNKNTWEDLNSRINQGEKVEEIALATVESSDGNACNQYFSTLFFTNQNNIYIYKVNQYRPYASRADFLTAINLKDVKVIDYTISLETIDVLPNGIPTNVAIVTGENQSFYILNLYGFITEKLIESVNALKNTVEKDPVNRKKQIYKIEQLYSSDAIGAEYRNDLMERAQTTAAEYRKKVWEECFYCYLDD